MTPASIWNAAVAYGTVLGPLLIITAVLLSAFRKIPSKYYGRISTFEKRGRLVTEGLYFRIPFIQKVELYSRELQRIPLDVTVTTKDQLELVLQLSVEFYPDLRLSTIYEDTAKERASGLVERIKTVVGAVAGVEKAENFVRHRSAIVQLINCVLRLKDLPHENILVNEWIRFYELLAKEVEQLLEKESDNPEERSSVELDYGVDIKIANLTKVDFSPATKAALEKNKQMQAAARATQQLLGAASTAKTKLGLEGREAANFAHVTAGLARKEVVSIEGGAAAPLPLLNVGGNK